jgi:hypothetical protein
MKAKLHSLFIALALLAGIKQSAAQGTTAFTYQGQLQDGGTNANGTYTMIFELYDSVSGGNQIATALTNRATLANGLFSVNLDFGVGAFDGTARWLDTTITKGGTTQGLSPRVQVLPTPYALFSAVAATVTNGAITTAQLAAGAVTDANLSPNTALTKTLAETNLVIIRGTLNSSGTVVAGQGFAVTVTSSTTRTITFNAAFSSTPTITLGQHGTSGGSIVDLVSSSTSNFSTVANGSAGFEFIAIGPQ